MRQTLRQDPDVICVGEMRDLETIATVLTLAETGHLVLSTLHTSNSVETINRIIDVFPPHQQEQVRIQVAACLSAVIAQKLLPVIDGSGRIVATELLVVDNAVKNLIKLNKIDQIFSILETGKGRGMHNMDSEIMRLYQRKVISKDVAYGNLAGKEVRESLKSST